MQDRLKAILDRIKAFWDKFNKKQKILFVSLSAAILTVIIIVAVIASRPKMVTIRQCSNESEATEVRALLNDNNITCQVDEKNVVTVKKDDYVEAKLVLGSNNISADGYSLSDALSGGFTETAATTEKKYTAFLESKFKKDLETLDGVKEARVTIKFQDAGSTIFKENTDASITAILKLTKEMSEEQAAAIGLTLATNVGSDNTNNVVVMDSNSNLLYYGGTNNTYGVSSSSQKVREQLENALIAKAKQLLSSLNYNEVTVSPNLSVDFDNVEIVDKEYHAPEGTDEGLYKTSYEVDSSGDLALSGGAAGTESNDNDTDYDIKNADGGNSKYSLKQYEWYQNEKITTTKPAQGKIDYNNSSISIVANKVENLTEEDAKERGLLEDMSWEEFKNANREPVPIELDDQIKNVVATGTGIPVNSINLMGYSSYVFYDAEKKESSPFFIVQIILAALIAALLIFIIIRSTRPVAVNETEPELSVEDMLATTKENRPVVEDIDVQEKSEVRIAIEKFVDENPEAVALLLRNWLNEGWN